MQQRYNNAVITFLFEAAICTELCVSANFLTYIGVPYVTEGGAFIFKLHPGTDLLILACTICFISEPFSYFDRLPSPIRIYFGALLTNVVFIVIFSGVDNLVVLFDTFLPAGLTAALLGRVSPKALMKLRTLMQCLFVLNAVLALTEAFAKATLIPLYLSDEAYKPSIDDFRPTALYDHPLTGALMAMMALTLTPPSGVRKAIYLTLMWAAMLAFGGRVAILTSLVAVLLTKGAPMIAKALAFDRHTKQRMLITISCLLLAAPIVVVIVSIGLADRLVGHLYWDASAQIRLKQWDILSHLDWVQIIFGTPRRELLDNLNALRLSSGVGVIENFWLLMFVSLGIVGFPIFLIAMAALFLWCWKVASQSGRVLLVSVIFAASASNSLGRKSTVLVCLVASIACNERHQGLRPESGDLRRYSRPVQMA